MGSAVKEEKTCSPLVELVNLGPGFSSVSLPKYQNHVWIKTLIFSPESSVELGISLFSPSLINPKDQIPDQEVSAEVLWAPL